MTIQQGLRTEQASATRRALITAARELFARQGYHGSGTHEIVARAKVSRGALYHHFEHKEGLFLAVFQEVELDIMMAAAAQFEGRSPDPWTHLQDGIAAFLTAIATRPDAQRILLVDGPAVLGWSRWRELEAEAALGHIRSDLLQAMEVGAIRTRPVDALSHLVLAALNEASLLIAHAADPVAIYPEVEAALRTLMDGLR